DLWRLGLRVLAHLLVRRPHLSGCLLVAAGLLCRAGASHGDERERCDPDQHGVVCRLHHFSSMSTSFGASRESSVASPVTAPLFSNPPARVVRFFSAARSPSNIGYSLG